MSNFEENKKETEGEGDNKGSLAYPLVQFSDLPDETKTEILDLVTGIIEKYINTDLQAACKAVKETMDKIYGSGWHCIVGKAFGFDVTYQKDHIIYFFFGGNLGILLWKCN